MNNRNISGLHQRHQRLCYNFSKTEIKKPSWLFRKKRRVVLLHQLKTFIILIRVKGTATLLTLFHRTKKTAG